MTIRIPIFFIAFPPFLFVGLLIKKLLCQIRPKHDKWDEYLLSRVMSLNPVLKKWHPTAYGGQRNYLTLRVYLAGRLIFSAEENT
jgi:hypothetical protein